jgi:hypothetical protein
LSARNKDKYPRPPSRDELFRGAPGVADSGAPGGGGKAAPEATGQGGDLHFVSVQRRESEIAQPGGACGRWSGKRWRGTGNRSLCWDVVGCLVNGTIPGFLSACGSRLT